MTIRRFCDAVDRLNEAVGWLLGPLIVFIAGAIVYEVVARSGFGLSTIWVSEASVYGASAVYLLAGGYAMRHRRHVRIDLVLGALSPRLARILELVTFPFLLIYLLTLAWVGGQFAITSFLQHEGTGTPWNPPIWPIKFCIPIAGLLLILQAFSHLFRELGLAPPPPATKQ